jgi:uncharacterized protein (DUF1800 family)
MVDRMAATFTRTDGDIGAVLRTMLLSKVRSAAALGAQVQGSDGFRGVVDAPGL